jgi:hypothetical protein
MKIHMTILKFSFYVVLDCVIGNLTTRYEAARNVDALFGVLWEYRNMSKEDMQSAAMVHAERYSADVSDDLASEIHHLKTSHEANLGTVNLSPLELLNSLHTKIDILFLNIIVLQRIFCTLPVTVAHRSALWQE